jgi:hypothetical protein
MKISQTYRADSAPQEPKSALRGLIQRLGLTLLAGTLVIGATEAQQAVNATTQAAPPISGVIGKAQSFTGSALDVQTPSGVVHVDVKQPLTTSVGRREADPRISDPPTRRSHSSLRRKPAS